MARFIHFGARSTADQVLAGIDLTRKRIVVTGCNSGIGFETMNALAANGAHVIGLARTRDSAQAACESVGPSATAIGCDLSNLESVEDAADSILSLPGPLDAVITNAGIANLPTLQTRYGVELQFLVNHIAHFALVNRLADAVRSGTGRIVIVSSDASIKQAPAEGVMFDNLDGKRFYDPFIFYGQAKLAAALYAKELSRRLASRGVSVNSLHPGGTRGTGIDKYRTSTRRLSLRVARLFMKSPAQGAATQALLAASPQVAGISGEYWSDCQIAPGNPLLADEGLSRRLWERSEYIVSSIGAATTNTRMGAVQEYAIVDSPPLRRVRRAADFAGL
jgi:NAD(P)-dependent dehydrogenase (short-subunit alcohol dehydrogenase family)